MPLGEWPFVLTLRTVIGCFVPLKWSSLQSLNVHFLSALYSRCCETGIIIFLLNRSDVVHGSHCVYRCCVSI